MKTVQDRLKAEELAQLKWLMGSVLTLLSLWSLWLLKFQLEGLILLGAAVVSFAIWRPQVFEGMPERVWKMAAPVILLVIILDFALNVPARSEFLPPLVRMVMLLLIYRCLAPRRRREDMQLILLCLFCVVLAGVLSVSLLFAVQILLFMPIAMGLLFTICLLRNSQSEEPEQLFRQQFSLRGLLGRVRLVMDYKFLGFGAFLFACMVVVSTFIFVLMPRFNFDQAIPFLQVSGEARAGFTSEVRLGKVTEIREDNREALRVDVPSFESMTERPYWRMLVLDRYSEGLFRQSNDATSLLRMGRTENQGMQEARVLDAWQRWKVPGREQTGAPWTFYFEGGVSEFLPLPGQFSRLRFDSVKELFRNDALLTIEMDVVQQSVLSYQLYDVRLSSSVPATGTEVAFFESAEAATVSVGSEEEVFYPVTNLELFVPEADRSYLEEVNAALIEGGSLSGADYGQRVVSYLQSNYQYTLSPDNGRGEGDEVVRWMRSGGSGHCEYFAASMILLARQAGYPARMAVGFAGGSWNSVEAYFVVRNSNAHAWVELYDAGSDSWLRFDPTPSSEGADAAIPFSRQVQIDKGWDAWLDSLRIQWYRRVVSFDQDDQLELAETAKGFMEGLSKSISEGIQQVIGSAKDWWAGILSTGDWWRILPLIVVVAILWVVVRSVSFWRMLWFRIFKGGQQMDPLRKQAGVYMGRLKEKQTTLVERGQIVPSGFEALRADLEAIRFGPVQDRSKVMAVFGRAKREI